MPDTFWFLIVFASVYVAFVAGATYGITRAWKDADKIIDGYKEIANEAIGLVEKYVIGGENDG